MKTLTLLFSINFFFFFNLYAQKWQEFKMPAGSDFFRKMYKIDDHIWGLDSKKGMIYRSDDEGKNWSLLKNFIGKDFFLDVQFVNKDIGYLCGTYGFFQKTIDGGQTWEDIAPEYDMPSDEQKITKRYLHSLFFQDKLNGIVEGWDESKKQGEKTELIQKHFYFKTADGGKSWKRIDFNGREKVQIKLDFISTSIPNNKVAMHTYFNNDIAYGVGMSGVNISKDYCKTWESFYYPELPVKRPSMRTIHFINNHQGYVFGGNDDELCSEGYILETLDGGHSWRMMNTDLTRIHSTVQNGKNLLLSTQNKMLIKWTPEEKQPASFIHRQRTSSNKVNDVPTVSVVGKNEYGVANRTQIVDGFDFYALQDKTHIHINVVNSNRNFSNASCDLYIELVNGKILNLQGTEQREKFKIEKNQLPKNKIKIALQLRDIGEQRETINIPESGDFKSTKNWLLFYW